jgi:riboflavin synthase
LNEVKIGDSISVNGVCLTVTEFSSKEFTVDAVGDTLLKTTINSFKVGTSVNLERALILNQRLGGHIVQGHVNEVGLITELKKLGENYSVSINLPLELARYIIPEGSIAIDGISLTIAKVKDSLISLSIIPHTWAATNLNCRRVGDKVNIEVDIIAKYVEKLLSGNMKNKENISRELLIKMGY